MTSRQYLASLNWPKGPVEVSLDDAVRDLGEPVESRRLGPSHENPGRYRYRYVFEVEDGQVELTGLADAARNPDKLDQTMVVCLAGSLSRFDRSGRGQSDSMPGGLFA